MEKEQITQIKLAQSEKEKLNDWEKDFIKRLYDLSNHCPNLVLSEKQADTLKKIISKLTKKPKAAKNEENDAEQ